MLRRFTRLLPILVLMSLAGAPAHATLSVGSTSVDTTGKIVTVNIASIGTGPLLPASGVTGFTIAASGQNWYISSATAGSSTVTLTLSASIPSGATVTISYVPGNLTDSASTICSPATNNAVTNSSTAARTGFAATNSALTFGGSDGPKALNGNPASPDYILLGAGGGEVETNVTGTECVFLAYQGTTYTFNVSNADGSSNTQTSITTAASTGLQWYGVFTGLSDAVHRIQITSTASIPRLGGNGGNIFWVSGASPAVALCNGYGTAYAIDNSTWRQYFLASSTNTAFAAGKGYQSTWPTSWITYNATESAAPYLYMSRTSGVHLQLWVDGKQSGSLQSTSSTPTFGWVQAIPDGVYDGSQVHHYTILNSESSFSVYQVMLPTGSTMSATIPTGGPQNYPTYIAGYGDSITFGAGVAPHPEQDWIWLLGQHYGQETANRGISGTLVYDVSGSDTTAGMRRMADVTGLPKYRMMDTCILYGRNDVTAGVSLTNYEAAYVTMLNGLLSGEPHIKIWCRGQTGIQSAGLSATDITYDNMAQVAVLQVITQTPGAAGHVAYVPGNAYAPLAPSDYFDSLHVNQSGNLRIAKGFTRAMDAARSFRRLPGSARIGTRRVSCAFKTVSRYSRAA